MGSLGDQKLAASKKIREHEALGETHRVSHDLKKCPIGWGPMTAPVATMYTRSLFADTVFKTSIPDSTKSSTGYFSP